MFISLFNFQGPLWRSIRLFKAFLNPASREALDYITTTLPVCQHFFSRILNFFQKICQTVFFTLFSIGIFTKIRLKMNI